ncbi:MAG TPA: hypothetical protein VEK08_04735 [Planctomycetota bacterium]|nr:hypothetical protein [Planctomycetota bacterium]
MAKTKRRWFQIHLSTAVVMMFVAGALCWANFGSVYQQPTGYGFPMMHYVIASRGRMYEPYYEVNILASLFNIGFFIGVLVITANLCERWILHRENRS